MTIIKINHYMFTKLFDQVYQMNPNYKSKIDVIEGDLLLPHLGISQHDRQILIDNVNIIFHSAATVRFDEPLK